MTILSVKKLYELLDYWTMIGIDSDIYECKAQRPWFTHYVNEAQDIGLTDSEITKYTLIQLKKELELPFYRQRTFWILLKMFVKKLFI